MPPDMRLAAISAFRLVTQDAERLVPFYEALGFTAQDRLKIEEAEMALLGLAGAGWRTPLVLGESRIDLDQFDKPGAPYPRDADAADPVFQHLALVTGDARESWGKALAAGAIPISRRGPVMLPASAGGVTAVKFRDLEGHPLELLEFPADSNSACSRQGNFRIDHSAISVANVDVSKIFYAGHRLKEGNRTINHGPTQMALDDLEGVEVDVVPMIPAENAPHVELLGYRRPQRRCREAWATNDVAATRIIWSAGFNTLLRDPDGHLHQLTR